MERPSVYLVEKADALGRALDFFIGEKYSKYSSADEKRLVFLAQIDFWAWELDNLIYSYESFKERAEMWDKTGKALGGANANGFLVRAKILRSVRWSNFYEKYSYKRRPQTVAPHELLNSVIDRWNSLLNILEKSVLDPNAVNLLKGGLMGPNPTIFPDTSKFRRSHVVPMDDEHSNLHCT